LYVVPAVATNCNLLVKPVQPAPSSLQVMMFTVLHEENTAIRVSNAAKSHVETSKFPDAVAK
jgi:hypothetical protein